MKKLLLVVVFGLIASHAWAQNVACSTGYTVFYGNGIRTSKAGAEDDLDHLVALYGTSHNGQAIDYQLMYNPTDGKFGSVDFLEVAKQKVAELRQYSYLQLQEAWLWLVNPSYQVDQLTEDIAKLLSQSLSQTVADAIKQTNDVLSDTQYEDDVVKSMANTYRPLLLEGRKVLVVAHSQGNLYANATYRKLEREAGSAYDMSAFGIAAIATPASGVPRGGPYVTSLWDLVVGVLRTAIPTTLPANYLEVFPRKEDWLGHSFTGIYANPALPISGRTKSVIAQALNNLSNDNTNTSGPFTLTLTWDKAGDVDLEVLEPSSNLVYWYFPYGDGGYLDRDDRRGTGPEHYYTSCTAPLEGMYKAGVNYYEGLGTRTATLVVSVNGVVFPARHLALPEAKGPDGVKSPEFVFTVVLKKRDGGGFDVVVQ